MLGDDFTVRGGSADATIPKKPTIAERMADEFRLPIIRIIEGSGGGGSVKTIETAGRANLPGGSASPSSTTSSSSTIWARVPVVALGLGSVAGLGAARLAASHYSIMTKKTSAMFVAGPPVVDRASARSHGKQELGGWEVQMPGRGRRPRRGDRGGGVPVRSPIPLLSAVIDLQRCRHAPSAPTASTGARKAVHRSSRAIAARSTRCGRIIDAVVDKGSFFEMGQMFGRAMITGFARLDGLPVAVLASDPYHYGGAWTADACDKIVRFVDLAETFHLPVVYLVRLSGLPHRARGGEIGDHPPRRARHGRHQPVERAVVHGDRAQRRSASPAPSTCRPAGSAIRYAWLSGWWGSLPLEGGIEAAYRAEIDAAPDRAAKLAEIEARLNALRSPFRTAETFWVEEIIDPRDTRKLLCEFANLAEPLRTPGPRAFSMRP